MDASGTFWRAMLAAGVLLCGCPGPQGPRFYPDGGQVPPNCQPACSGRSCGDDGCAGSCGSCPGGQSCSAAGTCQCAPQCAGKQCGSDGCGGSCGTCSAPQVCSASGTCQCTPQCSGKQCGDDGCGGSCGACGQWQACAAGACVATCDLPPLSGTQVKNIDLTVANVTGTVTLNGAQLPDAGTATRGDVVFIDRRTGSRAYVPVGPAGPGAYAAPLYAGTYGVHFYSFQSPVMPDGEVAFPDLVVPPSGPLNLDLHVVHVGGQVTVNGAQPAPASNRGRALYTRTDTGSVATAAIATTGAATYAAALYAGTYDVAFDSNTAPNLPAQSVTLQRGLALAADSTQDLALTTVATSGVVTVNGSQPPSGTRGNVVFSGAGASAASFNVATSGPAQYSALLFAGTYDVGFASTSSTVLPPESTTVLHGVTVTTAPINLNLSVVTVSGRVTLNGADLPSSSTSRGGLYFTQPGGSVSAGLGTSGPSTYSLSLYAGTYDVSVDGRQSQVLPAMYEIVKPAQPLTTSSTLDVPLTTVHVTGSVTLNGGPLPDGGSAGLGTVWLQDPRTASGPGATVVGHGAPAAYDVAVYPGSYRLLFYSATNQTLLPQGETLIQPTLQVSGATSADVPLQTATLSGTVTVNGAQMADDPAANSRGTLELFNPLTGDYASADLGAKGPALYAITRFAGGVDVEIAQGQSSAVLPGVYRQVLRGCLDLGGSCSGSASDLTGSWSFNQFGYGAMAWNLVQSPSGALSGSLNAAPVVVGQVTGDTYWMTVNIGQYVDLVGTVQSGCVLTGRAIPSFGFPADFWALRLH